MSTDGRTRAWVEIDGAALHRNLARMAAVSGGVDRLMPVVKSDAYGLGLAGVVRELESVGPWGYGVAEVREAEAIRRLGATRPVVILNSLPPDDVPSAVDGGFHVAVSSLQEVDRLATRASASGRVTRVHVEVDTGMGRAGFDWNEVREWGPALKARIAGRLEWTGLFSHLHSADEPDSGSAVVQSERFRGVSSALRAMGADGWVEHLCNSAGALRTREAEGDLVRPGIFLYGARAGLDLPAPDPVVSLRARVVLVRDVPAGTTLGYGSTYRASGPERWATVAIGYGDGLPRSLGNRGRAVVAGRSVAIVGRISMGLTVVDITTLPESEVPVGLPVTFVGREGAESIAVEEVAEHAGTISYEVFTGLSAGLPRVWVGRAQGREEPELPMGGSGA